MQKELNSKKASMPLGVARFLSVLPRNISNQTMMERRIDWHDFLLDPCENDARVQNDLRILARYDNHSLFCGEKEIIYGV